MVIFKESELGKVDGIDVEGKEVERSERHGRLVRVEEEAWGL
jgi:hypothetical protein